MLKSCTCLKSHLCCQINTDINSSCSCKTTEHFNYFCFSVWSLRNQQKTEPLLLRRKPENRHDLLCFLHPDHVFNTDCVTLKHLWNCFINTVHWLSFSCRIILWRAMGRHSCAFITLQAWYMALLLRFYLFKCLCLHSQMCALLKGIKKDFQPQVWRSCEIYF